MTQNEEKLKHENRLYTKLYPRVFHWCILVVTAFVLVLFGFYQLQSGKISNFVIIDIMSNPMDWSLAIVFFGVFLYGITWISSRMFFDFAYYGHYTSMGWVITSMGWVIGGVIMSTFLFLISLPVISLVVGIVAFVFFYSG